MTVSLRRASATATPIHLVDRAGLRAVLPTLPENTRRWLTAIGFTGAPDAHALVPDEAGRLREVWAGVASPSGRRGARRDSAGRRR